MVVPRSGPEAGEVERALAIPRITRILVDGDGYVPVYVSEAKDPPVQAERPLTGERSRLELIMDGGEWTFEYSGAFAKHLAETAAHGASAQETGEAASDATPQLAAAAVVRLVAVDEGGVTGEGGVGGLVPRYGLAAVPVHHSQEAVRVSAPKKRLCRRGHARSGAGGRCGRAGRKRGGKAHPRCASTACRPGRS